MGQINLSSAGFEGEQVQRAWKDNPRYVLHMSFLVQRPYPNLVL
jgi:hypothetical protein